MDGSRESTMPNAVRGSIPRPRHVALALSLLAAASVAGSEHDDPPADAAASTAASAPGAPAAVPERFSLGPSFDLDLLRDLPRAHGVFSLFETLESTAIVDRIENGGLYVGEPALLGIRGTSWTQTTWLLGDFDITDPDRTGTPLLLVDPEALESIEAAANLMPADLGGAGPVATLTLRRPGDVWSGSAHVDLVPAGLQQRGRASGVPFIARYRSYSSGRFRLDGPLRPDLRLLLSGSFARSRRLERDDPRSLLGRELGLLSHLVWTPTPADEVRILSAVQGTRYPFAGRARFGGGDVGESARYFHLHSTWQRRADKPWSVTGGYARGSFDPDVAGLSAGPVVERLRHGPLPRLYPGRRTSDRLALKGRMDPLRGEHHALQVGLSLAWARSSTRPAGAAALTPESVNGLPARVWDYGRAGPESRWRAFDLAAYGRDRVTYGRFSLDAGLHLESTSADADGGGSGIGWHALSPRVMARVRLTPGEGLAFFTGWSRYRHRLPLNLLAFGDPAAAQGVVYRWLDADGDRVFDPIERGPLVFRVGPGGPHSSIDPDLRSPRSRDVVVGFEGRLGGSWSARGLGYHRRERHLAASVDVGAPASAYELSFVPDPGGDILGADDDQLLPIYNRRPESFGADRYLLTNAGEAVDKGVELHFKGRIGRFVRVLIGGTASKSLADAADRGFLAIENDQGLVGERREDPNATTFSRGRVFFERGYTLSVAATCRCPRDLRVGVVARYQDGQHFSRFVIPPDLNQGPEPIQSIPNGRSRFTYVLTVDARLEKGFRVGRYRVAAIFEVFNLRGDALSVEEDVTTGPQFRTSSAVQPPRSFRIGGRIDF